MNDLRSAFRQLLKAPGFTSVAVLTLALGIGACSIVFGWIHGVLIDAIPGAADPHRLVVLTERHVTGELNETLSIPDVRDLATETNLFDGVIASQIEAVTLRIDRSVEWVWAQPTTANYFDVLGVRPVLGRAFRPDEDRAPRGNPVAVISHGLWQRRFGGTPDVVGRTVEISRRPFTIIGVAPAGFRGTMGGLGFDLWVPVTMSNETDDIARALQSRGWRWLHTVARLRDGVSIARAQVALETVMQRMETAYPDSNRDIRVAVLPLWKSPWGAQGRMLPLLTALAGVALLLLLLVIANLANLLLARASAREAEMAVRLALGARSGRLIRQVLVESLALSTLGGLGGLLVAAFFGRALSWMLPPTYLPLALHFEIDARILAFTALITLGSGLLFGLVPAWRATRTSLAGALKAGGRDGVGHRGGHRLRQALVIAEIAAALVLLVGMTLCTRSFERARLVQVGFEPRGVWIAGFRLPPGAYSRDEAASFYRRLRTELAQLPGVTSVGLTDWIPLGFEGGSSTRFSVPGYQPGPSEIVEAGVSQVSPAYFTTLRVPIARGREFDERDGPNGPPVVIINQRLADRYFPGRDALGLVIHLWDKPRTIIGITPTGKYRSLNEPPRSYLYVPVEQTTDYTLAAVVRTTGDPRAIATAVEQTALRLDHDVKPMAAMPLTDYMAAAYLIPQTAAVLLAILGSIAILLAALGIYAVIAWSVSRRVREVGVRMALGASRSGMIWMFVREGLRLAGIGTAFGLVGAVLGGRVLGNILVDVSAGDPLTYALAVPALALVAAAACWLPARRAARIEPMAALRMD